MRDEDMVFIGTDSGATTSKVGGVRMDGSPISLKLSQKPTDAQKGKDAILSGWIAAAETYLGENGLGWQHVGGVGLSIPGPFLAPGVLGEAANLPKNLDGWNVGADYAARLTAVAGHPIKVTVGNDGNYGGVAEAQKVRGSGKGTVIMLAPGSGLGAAFIDERGLPLDGECLTGMEAGHMPVPLQLLGDVPTFSCGCGRDWGCVESYTAIAGLPQLFTYMLRKHPAHPLAASDQPIKEKVFSLRTLAQKGDALALDIFDFQARVMGIHVANLAMAFDPEFVVIGGGLMDPESTTEAFRNRYLGIVEATARPYLWPAQQSKIKYSAASLGELSQAIGAALVALYNR
jgi:predicted NBD/HSP70 family sugar kinase